MNASSDDLWMLDACPCLYDIAILLMLWPPPAPKQDYENDIVDALSMDGSAREWGHAIEKECGDSSHTSIPIHT